METKKIILIKKILFYMSLYFCKQHTHTHTQTNAISRVHIVSHLSARAATRRSLEQVHNVQTKCLMRSPLKVTREGDDVTNESTVQTTAEDSCMRFLIRKPVGHIM